MEKNIGIEKHAGKVRKEKYKMNFALLYIPWLQGVLSADIKNNLKYFEVIHAKSFGHNIVKRGIHPSDHPFNKIREVNFKVRNKRTFF